MCVGGSRGLALMTHMWKSEANVPERSLCHRVQGIETQVCQVWNPLSHLAGAFPDCPRILEPLKLCGPPYQMPIWLLSSLETRFFTVSWMPCPSFVILEVLYFYCWDVQWELSCTGFSRASVLFILAVRYGFIVISLHPSFASPLNTVLWSIFFPLQLYISLYQSVS